MTTNGPSSHFHRLIAALAAFGLLVTACGLGAPPEPTPVPTPSEPQELRVYALDGFPIRQVLDILINDFKKKHPEYTVKVEGIRDDPVQELTAMAGSNTLPDVVFTIDSMTQSLIDAGVLLDMRELANVDKSFAADDIDPAALSAVSATDRAGLFAIPASHETVQMYYNKTMFEEAGAPLPQPDWTWDDLISACEQIQAANETVNCISLSTGGLFGPDWRAYWAPWVQGYGGSALSPDGKTSTLSSFESLTGLQAYADLWTKHKVAAPAGGGGECFVEQTCAVTFFVTSGVPLFTRFVGDKFEWGVQLVPAQPKGQFTGTGVYGFGIGKGSEHVQAAWDFVKYLATPEAQRLIVSSGLGMPMLKSMANDPAVKQLPPELQAFVEGAKIGIPPPGYPAKCGNLYTGMVQSAIAEGLRQVIQQGAEVEDAFKAVDAKIQACLGAE